MTQLGQKLTAEVERYLSAVEIFRAEGIEPEYQSEDLERPQLPRRELRAQTERVDR